MNPYFEDMRDMNLDKFLKLDENREPNHLGLYRMNCLVIGKTGSGKTTVLLKALLTDAIDNFSLLIFIIPRESMESGFYKKLEQAVRAGRIKKNIIFVIIGEEDLPTIQKLNEISNQVKGRIAIVLDDFINAFKKDEWLIFKRYITQLSRVKYGASLFCLTQNWRQIGEPAYRKNFNAFILFVNSLRRENFAEILTSYFDHYSFNKNEISQLYNIFKQDPHQPLWLINGTDEEDSMLYDGMYIYPDELLD